MRVPKYRRHSTRDRGFVEWRGRRHYFKGRYNSEESLAAYRQFLRDNVLKDESIDNEVPDVVPISGYLNVAEFCYRHLLWAESFHGRESQEFNHLYRCVKMLHNVGQLAVRDFGPLALKKVRRLMVEGKIPPRKDGTPAKRWSRSYINEQVNRIRRIFRWGVENELVPASVLQALKAVRPLRAGKTAAPETDRVEAVEWSQVELVLPFLTPVVADMVRLQGLTGMRSGELCRMTPGEIDRSRDPWVYMPGSHKTEWRGFQKIIYLGPKAQAILAPYLADRPKDKRIFTPAESIERLREIRAAARKTKRQPSQLARKPKARPKRSPGDHYTSNAYRHSIGYGIKRARKILAARAAKSGAEPPVLIEWHPHQIRHALANRVRAEFGLEASKAILGNTIEATQIYSSRDLELAKRVASSIG